jgi:hypothetical protein
MDYELAQERRDRLTHQEIEAIEFHVEDSRKWSIAMDRNAFALNSPDTYRENLVNSVLLSDVYPDNVEQIVSRYERSMEYRLKQQGFETIRF